MKAVREERAPTIGDAIERYYRAMRRAGFEQCSISQPSNTSRRVGRFWYLENCNGALARVSALTGKVFIPKR